MPEIKIKRFSRSQNKESSETSTEIPKETTNESSNQSSNESTEETNDPILEPNNMNNKFIEDIFEDLNNENFTFENPQQQTKNEKEQIKLEKEKLKLEIARKKEEERQMKELNKKTKPIKSNEDLDDGLFSNNPTEILGLDKRQMINKILEYKALFPSQLKTFKIKKNPTLEELDMALQEMEAIVQTDSVEGFITDSILQCIQMIEGVSARTKYNITGMSDMLKQNPQFNSLCKVLYIKHKVFSSISNDYVTCYNCDDC